MHYDQHQLGSDPASHLKSVSCKVLRRCENSIKWRSSQDVVDMSSLSPVLYGQSTNIPELSTEHLTVLSSYLSGPLQDVQLYYRYNRIQTMSANK